jgi:succinate dehydrogenase subunit C
MKTYRRPMAGWWRRNPYYLWYMLRELSCVLITAYALVLLWGLLRLTQGETAFEDWLENLSRPGAVAFHAVALVLVLYHAWTWFKVMPRTMPFVPVPDRAIVAAGVLAASACSAALFVAVWWFGLWSLP